jgi:hypothetical protein
MDVVSFHHPPKHYSFVTNGSFRWFASSSGRDGGNSKGGEGVPKKASLVDSNTFDNDDDDDDDVDDDEGWVPPDDSPLVAVNNTMTKKKKQQPSLSLASSLGSVGRESINNGGGIVEEEPMTVSSSLLLTDQQKLYDNSIQQNNNNNNNNDEKTKNEEEEEFILPSEDSIIEVIDVEATLANQYNRTRKIRGIVEDGEQYSNLVGREGDMQSESARRDGTVAETFSIDGFAQSIQIF